MSVTIAELNAGSVSSIGCGKMLKRTVFPQSIKDLDEIATQFYGEKKVFFGGMSNVLVASDFDGIAVFSDLFQGVSVNGDYITAYSGEPLTKICNVAQYYSLSGMENMCGIPGSVGGAIMNNSGSFGTSISEILDSVTVFDFEKMQTETLTRDEIAFGYRYCNLRKNKDFIISATFKLYLCDCQKIALKMAEVRRMRKEKQPIGKSLGSVFKQNNGISAGYYIEEAGLKGFCCGGMEISDKHANFIVNKGNGTAEEYVELVKLAENKIYEKFGIKLEREVLIFGETECKRDSN